MKLPRTYCSFLFLFCLVAVLVGCSTTSIEAPLQPALAPTAALPTPAVTSQAAQPAAPASAPQATTLPAPLLIVQGGNLWRLQEDASEQLTSSGDAFQPAVSPDGTAIVYVQRAISGSNIVRIATPAAGQSASPPTSLTDDIAAPALYSYERIYNSRWAFYPVWSPNGTTLAFASQFGPPSGSPAAEYRMSLFTITPEGSDERQVFGDSSGHVGRAAYAPDGSEIVFAFSPVGDDPPTLYRHTIATEHTEQLPGALQQSYDPAFFPDGRWLAFAARTSNGTDIFAMPAQGGSPVQLTTIGEARAPAFSADGRWLAFLAASPGSNSFDAWVTNVQLNASGALQAGTPRQLTTAMHLDADSGVAWLQPIAQIR